TPYISKYCRAAQPGLYELICPYPRNSLYVVSLFSNAHAFFLRFLDLISVSSPDSTSILLCASTVKPQFGHTAVLGGFRNAHFGHSFGILICTLVSFDSGVLP